MKALCYPCKRWEHVNPHATVGRCEQCNTPMSLVFTTDTRCRAPNKALAELRDRLSDDITHTEDYMEMEIQLERLLKESWGDAEDRLRDRHGFKHEELDQ